MSSSKVRKWHLDVRKAAQIGLAYSDQFYNMQVQSGATQPILTSRCWNQLKTKLLKIITDSPCAFRLYSERVSEYINVQLLSYTRAFVDGPRNFEPWSSDEDDT
ncbi:hypothetical protein TNCV_4990121 [Trichonephila clavipes]|uniref:Uncharacterized protein n=1 Tax=Trichonephila clavipes TaxID=2585209 RepID=A0A8X6WAT6_TRICX|nr:hypothetical protein TNCV_4990121 [Trichonephila clavipes]